MGLTFSSIFNQLFGKKDMRILMVGLDAAGETLTWDANVNTAATMWDKINVDHYVEIAREDNDPV